MVWPRIGSIGDGAAVGAEFPVEAFGWDQEGGVQLFDEGECFFEVCGRVVV